VRIFYRENSRVIEVPELTDHEGAAITGATVTATLIAEDGSALPGVTNPIAMNHEGAGRYVGLVPAVDVAEGTLVDIEVKATYTDVEATSRERFVVRDRAFADPCGSF